MNNKFNLVLSILIILFVGGITYKLLQYNSPGPKDTGKEEQKKSVNIPKDWSNFSTSSFSFSHPPQAQIDSEQEKIRVRFIGPDSEENTEITDGFTLYIDTEQIPKDSSVESLAQSKYESALENLESIQEPEQINIGGKAGYRFVVQSETGDGSNRIVMKSNSNLAYIVSYTISDPNNSGYSGMVDKMIKSLNLK